MNFFDIEAVEQVVTTPRPLKKAKSKERYNSCEDCGLYKQCAHGKMAPMGSGKNGIMIVLDSPTVQADRLGNPVSGHRKGMLTKLCKASGIKLNDCVITNAIQCRHRKVNPATIPTCRDRLKKDIEKYKPRVIIAMGSTALNVLIGDTLEIGKFDRWIDGEVPSHDYRAVIIPTYDFKMYNMENDNVVIWAKIMEQFAKASVMPTYKDYLKLLEAHTYVLTSQKEIERALQNSVNAPYVAFDYETTGLQPYRKGHDIISMSLAYNGEAYSFLVDRLNKPYIKQFLESEVPKIIHNAKFEITWSNVILGIEVRNVIADTMITAHCLNNTKGLTSLKFQSAKHFGIMGYEDEIKPLFESPEPEPNIHSFNKLYFLKQTEELFTVRDKLLTYGGYDSLLTLWLYKNQIQKLLDMPRLDTGVELFTTATKKFSTIEQHGMRIDTEAVDKNFKAITKKLEVLHELIMESKEVQLWDGDNEFSYTSNQDLSHLLYGILGFTAPKKTNKGNDSTDAYSLEKLQIQYDTEFLPLLLAYKKLDKIRGTYLMGIKAGTYNGIIHPSFNFHVAQTFRSSSSSPINLQNQPKRDADAKKYVRSVFLPRKGHKLEELDFKSLEVVIGACLHKDPQMIHYLEDVSSDMHTDTACDLFFRTKDTLHKEERDVTKSGFTFSQQYGSYYVNCAKTLWADMPEFSKKHLAKKGFKTLEQYTEHVRVAEDIFWNERFRVFGQWKKDNYKKYLRNGYIDMNTGFRSTVFLSRNQAANIETQGSAFHVLLSLLLRIQARLESKEMDTYLIGQIHDSIIADVNPAEEEIFHNIVKECLEDLTKEWEWIILPLTLEYEQTEVDKSWNTLEKKGSIRVA